MKRNVIRRKAIEPKSSAYNDPDPRDGGVQSVDRALSIIETLAEDDEGYRLSDLAVRTGLSTSTVHRLLATLESRRFVQFDRSELKWHVGARSFTVGATFARRRNFTAQAVPYLRKLRDLTRETANLAGDPKRHFLIDPEVQFALLHRLRGTGARILGCFHSHPGGLAEPSATDKSQAYEANFLYLIAGGDSASGFTLKAYVFDDVRKTFAKVSLAA